MHVYIYIYRHAYYDNVACGYAILDCVMLCTFMRYYSVMTFLDETVLQKMLLWITVSCRVLDQNSVQRCNYNASRLFCLCTA